MDSARTKKGKLTQTAAKLISYITIAPVVVFGVLTTLFFGAKEQFGNLTHYLAALFNLSVLPILAYPVQLIVPGLRRGGRAMQRKLAFVFAVAGYILGVVCAFVLHVSKGYWTVYLGYFFSGTALAFINRVIKVKASGHACGVAGPILLCVYHLSGFYWLLLLVIPLVFFSRMKLGRHSFRELLLGASTSTACTAAVLLVSSLTP